MPVSKRYSLASPDNGVVAGAAAVLMQPLCREVGVAMRCARPAREAWIVKSTNRRELMRVGRHLRGVGELPRFQRQWASRHGVVGKPVILNRVQCWWVSTARMRLLYQRRSQAERFGRLERGHVGRPTRSEVVALRTLIQLHLLL